MVTKLIIAAFVSTLVAFVMAAAESAQSRLSRHRAAELVEEDRRGASALAIIVVDSAAYLSAAAFVRVLAESTAAVLITLTVVDSVNDFWPALLISIGVMAVVSFVLVGVSPRTLGRQHADQVSLLTAPILVLVRRVLGPVARLLVTLGNAVTPGRGFRDGPFDSEAELRDLVDMAEEALLIEAGERQMIHSVFKLGDTVVREVMVPRTDMVTMDHDKTLRQAMSVFLRSGFSRIPVLGDGPDDVLGLLYFKDVARRVYGDAKAAKLPVHHQMRPARYVPPRASQLTTCCVRCSGTRTILPLSSTNTVEPQALSRSRTFSRRLLGRLTMSTITRLPESRSSRTDRPVCPPRCTSTTWPSCSR